MNLAKRFRDDTRDTIIAYLEAGGDQAEESIILTDKQKELLDRWRFADEKIREQRYRRASIVNFIQTKYGVSRDIAYRDIVCAEQVFSSSAPLNKKYLIQNRIEFLQKKIQEAYEAEDRFNAANLEKILQRYIDKYPDYQPPKSPKNINFIILNNNGTEQQASMQENIIKADEILKKLEENEDY